MFLTLWLIVGYGLCLVFIKIFNEEVCLKHLLQGIPCAILGPVWFIFIIVEISYQKEWKLLKFFDKKIW